MKQAHLVGVISDNGGPIRLPRIEGGAQPLPFLKWPGGKRRLVGDIIGRMPKQYGSYFEPFIGGICVPVQSCSCALPSRVCPPSPNRLPRKVALLPI